MHPQGSPCTQYPSIQHYLINCPTFTHPVNSPPLPHLP
jgi:hypothetical protein